MEVPPSFDNLIFRAGSDSVANKARPSNSGQWQHFRFQLHIEHSPGADNIDISGKVSPITGPDTMRMKAYESIFPLEANHFNPLNIRGRVSGGGPVRLEELYNDKADLIQKLNDSLIKLDRLNFAKKDLQERLIEQIKVVRDLEKALHHGDDVDGIVDSKMKSEFKREKEVDEHLRE